MPHKPRRVPTLVEIVREAHYDATPECLAEITRALTNFFQNKTGYLFGLLPEKAHEYAGLLESHFGMSVEFIDHPRKIPAHMKGNQDVYAICVMHTSKDADNCSNEVKQNFSPEQIFAVRTTNYLLSVKTLYDYVKKYNTRAR